MTTGRFDVVVVGVRARGDAALGDLAAAVGRATGLAPGAVQRGLEGGEVVVHQNLSKTQAVLAARTVQGLGAIVDVRPAREDGDAVAIEPDEPVVRARPPGEPPAPAPVVEPPPSRPIVEARAPTSPSAASRVAAPVLPPRLAALAVPQDDAKLELDLDRAGLSAPAPEPVAGRVAAPLPPHTPMAPRVRHAPPVAGYFAVDRVTSALLGVTLGVLVGGVVAWIIVRSGAQALDEAALRSRYFALWAGLAIPLAGIAALLKRPN